MTTSEKQSLLQSWINDGSLFVMDMENKRIVIKGGLYLQKDGNNIQLVVLQD